MGMQRTPLEELTLHSTELDAAMQAVGFHPVLVDQESEKDLSFRVRYLRIKGAVFPRLQANLEYYLATQSYTLRISADAVDEKEERTYYFIVKNCRTDLKQLLSSYFESVRRGMPLVLPESKGPA